MLGVAHDADASTVNGLMTAPLPPPCSDSCTDVVGPFANNPATPTCAAASVAIPVFGRLCDGEIGNWPGSVTCQQSCADVGHNYADPPCCTSRPSPLLSPPLPSPLSPEPLPPSPPPTMMALPPPMPPPPLPSPPLASPLASPPLACPGTRAAFRNPAFTLPVYPALDPANLPTQAEHGVLGQLDGVWVNAPGAYGIHTTIMPAPGTTSEQMFGAFHFLTQEY